MIPEVFESPEKKDKERVADVLVNIEIDLNSISSFLRVYPDAPMKMWERALRYHRDKGYLQSEEDVNNFLHDFLNKWWEYHNPGERTGVKKAQTATAVKELRKAVLASKPEDEVKDEQGSLSKETWRRFIEHLKRSHEEAGTKPRITKFESFAGKVFAPIGTSGAKKGLEITYQSVPDTLTETPIQKYRRLKAEITEFAESLKEVKADGNADPDAPTAASISEDLSKLRAILSQPGSNILPQFKNGEPATGGEYLQSELSSHLAKARKNQSVEPAVFSLSSEVTTHCDEATLMKLDERLSKLEKIFGQDETIDIETKSDALSSINFINSQIDILSEPGKARDLEERVKELNGQLDLLTKSLHKKSPATVGMSKRTTKLLEKMPIWDKASTQLPIIVDRLKNLRELNVDAAGVSDQVSKIKEQQETLSATLDEDRALLKQVFETFSSNVEEIHASVKSLDERIASLTIH